MVSVAPSPFRRFRHVATVFDHVAVSDTARRIEREVTR
ncbi:hypothetical protein Natpe_0281 [Natrinema pellirubrum DSM 15624]|uniref:Uncharacterized protein n=1 Tax=Natrinema pellirubrum (strain DSM 15624 / CIP 106293 / JCM 10476 / NCIMB 786 / 157) TaxID=797303 RepID=L0JFA6_NATP1|nr:hypothetical protein Natpe_0281 [Natrinema pellirubrum DSM 15624]